MSQHPAATLPVERNVYVPSSQRKHVALECHIKPFKLALLNKLSLTQNKSNCVIYLIADENVALKKKWVQIAYVPERICPVFSSQWALFFLSFLYWYQIDHSAGAPHAPRLPSLWPNQALGDRRNFPAWCFSPSQSSFKCFRLAIWNPLN